MTEYDWLDFWSNHEEEMNKIQNKPIVLKNGLYSCYADNNGKLHYFKYSKKIEAQKVPTLTLNPYRIKNNTEFIIFTGVDMPSNPKQNAIYCKTDTKDLYVYVNSRWALLITDNNQYEVRGGLGNAYIETYDTAQYYTKEITTKTITNEHWVNEEITRQEWLGE